MLRIELKAAASGQPGHGELAVHGWPQGGEGIELTVQRNQDGHYLGADGAWISSPAWHPLEGLRLDGETLGGEVGPWLIDPLMRDPQMVYRLQLRDADGGDVGVLRIIGNILSSQAAGSSLHDDERISRQPVVEPAIAAPEPAPAPQAAPEPEPELLPEPEPEPEPERAPPPEPVIERQAPPEPRPPKWPWIAAIVGLLLIAAALAWFFVFREPAPAVEPVPPAGDVAAADAGACGATALGGSGDDLVFIQSCLRSNPSSAQVLALIAAAREAGRCGVVQRLYAHKAQSGDAAIAFAYAREYDPQSFSRGGCVDAADAETAAYWYEVAVNNDPENVEARERLEALSQ